MCKVGDRNPLESSDGAGSPAATQTNASWFTEEQALFLAFRSQRFGAFGSGITGADITADADFEDRRKQLPSSRSPR